MSQFAYFIMGSALALAGWSLTYAAGVWAGEKKPGIQGDGAPCVWGFVLIVAGIGLLLAAKP